MDLVPARPVLAPPAPLEPPLAGGSPAAGDDTGKWTPPTGLPPVEKITYVKEVVTTLLLLLALPYIVAKALTNPRGLIVGLGKKHAA